MYSQNLWSVGQVAPGPALTGLQGCIFTCENVSLEHNEGWDHEVQSSIHMNAASDVGIDLPAFLLQPRHYIIAVTMACCLGSPSAQRGSTACGHARTDVPTPRADSSKNSLFRPIV